MRRGYAESPWGQLHYAEAGGGEQVVLMLHQTPRSHDEFAEVQEALNGQFRTIAMDLPGFGHSAAPPGTPSIEGFAAGAIALLDALDIDTAVIMGHHTGAMVAVECAVTHPERAAALVVSGLSWMGPAERQSDRELPVDRADTMDDGAHLMQLWAQRRPYYPPARPDLLNRYLRDALKPGLDLGAGHRACHRYALDERIGSVSCPTLLLIPDADPFAAPSAERVLAGFTGTRTVGSRTVPGGSIALMEQCADVVAAEVGTFLGGVSSR